MDVLFLLFAVILGAILGSFINAAVYRLKNDISLLTGRSKCVHCDYQLKVIDLIPVGSFLLLQGKCRSCSKPIPHHYFWVEAVMGLLFLLAMWLWLQVAPRPWDFFDLLFLIRDWLAISVMVFLFVFDLKYYLLPDIVTLPAFVIFTVISLVLGMSITNLLLGVVIGAGFFLLQYLVSKGRWVGGGDIRLGAVMGALLGWPLIIPGLFIAYLLGSIVAIYLLRQRKKTMKSTIPFGTFLAVSSLITLWWGADIVTWYLSFL